MSLEEHIQRVDAGNQIQLFYIDLTKLDGETVLRFTPTTDGSGGSITFDGNVYTPTPMEATGFEWSGNTSFPRPHLTLTNIGGALGALMKEYNDLLGQEIVRMVTYKRFLDGEPDADPQQRLPDEYWIIDRKVKQNRILVEFELASPVDQEGVMLPRRQVLKDACVHIYRRWNETMGDFDYLKATCPYSAPESFDSRGVPTTMQNDVCGKRFSDCRARKAGFPSGLPFLGFPGTAPLNR